MKKKALFSWSGGKDSALCLHKILEESEYEIVGLQTNLNANYQRVSMHGIRVELLEKQAESIGIPLIKMFVREGSNKEYEKNMEKLLRTYKEQGVDYVIYGDIFLEDLREYRDDNLAKIGMKGIYPLWKQDTNSLVREFIDKGFATVICCVNDAWLGEDRAGTHLDKAFLNSLPENVDPCGENGEFHTFCYDGPIFDFPIVFETGARVYKPLELKAQEKSEDNKPVTKGFWYCDLY